MMTPYEWLERAKNPDKLEQIFNKIKEYKVVIVHTPELSQASELLSFLEEKGYFWNSGISLSKNQWNIYGKRTCYEINNRAKSLCFSPKEFYERENMELDTDIKILNFGDL